MNDISKSELMYIFLGEPTQEIYNIHTHLKKSVQKKTIGIPDVPL